MNGSRAHVPAASTASTASAGHAYGPTGPGSVILELGEHIGALILVVPPDLAGHEIEISPSAGGPRTHSLVRERVTAAGVSYAAVYPAVAAGEYTVWQDDRVAVGQVAVNGGEVSRFRWPGVTPAGSV